MSEECFGCNSTKRELVMNYQQHLYAVEKEKL